MPLKYTAADLCPGCGSPWEACSCDADDEYEDEDRSCTDCDGHGWVMGEDISRYYDFGWIDERKAYKCRNCGGSGLAKDMTSW